MSTDYIPYSDGFEPDPLNLPIDDDPVDADGHMHTMLDSILDHSKDGNAVECEDMYVVNKSGNRRMRETTNGWKPNMYFRYGSEKQKRQIFDDIIRKKLGDAITLPEKPLSTD